MQINKNKRNSVFIPDFMVSGFNNSNKSLKARFQSIFEDAQKKRGLLITIVVLSLTIVLCSVLVFGNNQVKQINDSLTVYIRGNNVGDYDYATYLTPQYNDCYNSSEMLKDYADKYPDVKLNVVEFTGMPADEFYTKLSSEILSGEGPDVVIGDTKFGETRDIYKMIKSSAFEELDDFIANDPDSKINLEDYYDFALDECRYKGKLYALPLRLDFPLFTSSKNNLDAFGIDTDACSQNYINYFGEASKYLDTNSIEYFLPYNNILLDNAFLFGLSAYDKKGISSDSFKQSAQSYKNLYKYDVLAKQSYDPNAPLNDTFFESYLPATTIMNQKRLLFCSGEGSAYSDYHAAICNIKLNDSPVIIPLRNPNGGISAQLTSFAVINSSSANKQNAYNFIKTLMGSVSEYYFNQDSISCNKLYAKLAIKEKANYKYVNYNAKYDTTSRGWSDAEFNTFMDILSEIDKGYFKTPIDYEIIRIMTPYFNGEKSYEECFSEVEQKVKIYLSE